jgi:myo-inositol-1-phosphate synthase
MSSSSSLFASGALEVESPNVTYTPEEIVSTYSYDTTSVTIDEASGRIRAVPTSESLKFVTQRTVPRVGVMLVGWGGNNGTTVTGGILANRHGITWRTKVGV